MRIGFQPFSSPRAVSLIILSSIRMTPRLPAWDHRIRCVRISPWFVPNDVGMLRFCEARQIWFRRAKFTDTAPTLLSLDGEAVSDWQTRQCVGNTLVVQLEDSWMGEIVQRRRQQGYFSGTGRLCTSCSCYQLVTCGIKVPSTSLPTLVESMMAAFQLRSNGKEMSRKSSSHEDLRIHCLSVPLGLRHRCLDHADLPLFSK